MSCPLPILKTKKAVEALSKDQILKVETTDPGSKNDMASWAKRTGNEIVKVEELRDSSRSSSKNRVRRRPWQTKK